jgi:hypothetical protein
MNSEEVQTKYMQSKGHSPKQNSSSMIHSENKWPEKKSIDM